MRPRATIGVQLLILLIGCLLVMHLIILVVIALTPPPRPPIYRYSEIASALNGGGLEAADGPRLRRTTVSDLPRELVKAPASPGLEALALAVDRPATRGSMSTATDAPFSSTGTAGMRT